MEETKRKIGINPDDPKRVYEIRTLLRENKEKYGKSYCPCSIERNDDTVCPCKAFREDESVSKCHCGLFVRK